MTQEQKARAYDEALKVLHKYDGANIMFSQSLKEEMFPELKESEDKQSKKWILEYLYDGLRNSDEQFKGQFKAAIAWLEKQGSQKSVDKAEPKFKVGDIIINKENGAISKANKILPYDYELISFETGKRLILDQNLINENSKLWAIQDAKDGDVLCSEQIILLFKKWEYNSDWNYVIAYAVIDITGKLQITNEHLFISNHAHPATKEQRDILFQKLKETGYEWDAEKKELKKIEQKQVIDYPDDLPKDNWELVHEFIGKFGRIPKDEDELNVLVEYVLKRQNPAWSEEDEEIWDKAKQIFPESLNMQSAYVTGYKDVLKHFSLKKEWSEEDMAMLDSAIAFVEHSAFTTIGKGKNNVIAWLKSLRPQNTWKPSEEQMEYLGKAVNEARKYHNSPSNGHNMYDVLNSLYEQLEQL